MKKKKPKAKTTKTKAKPAKKAKTIKTKAKPAKKAKVATKKTATPKKQAVKAISPKEKVNDTKVIAKKNAPTFKKVLDEEMIEVAPVTASAFINDDFDTSRKELEEGYLDDEEEEDDTTKDKDLYADDETESFESYDEDDFDYDDEEEYGSGSFASAPVKKKKFEDDYEDDEEE